ncbi:MarR family winged helix-turn-helix transcriptional regulator [Hydrogenovibrio sp. JE_KL2]|uniref:MarR family winged helix-turn-helix transcriptional regulator n=1 Tax=Hydrogenovibrio sp. JE_KL2 TaxID=2651188 RepID=UPI00128BA177|nr:MarR family transcriptional regulator [Hydrogenovibrio sp. JE_KL2]MPQ76103.1 MarR family transcriptional regulator [Hydrogenovibrio sp. JE_KL2]
MSEQPNDSSGFKYKTADQSPGFVLWRLTTLWQKEVHDCLKAFSITQTQFALLASLKWLTQNHQPSTQQHLSTHTKIDKMTLSKAIRQLESAGWVRRIASEQDSRAVEVRLTPKGAENIQNAIMAVENIDEQFFSRLPTEELKQFMASSLHLINANKDKD